MAWTIIEDFGKFDAVAGPFLRPQPARNTVPLTILATLQATGLHAFGEQPPMFGWWQSPAGQVDAICLRTPPFPLLITDGPAEAIAELAVTLADAKLSPPGVNGSEQAASQFAAHWERLTGATATVYQRQRLYRLATLVLPSPVPQGRPRGAMQADRDLVADWFDAFREEAGSLADRDRTRTRQAVSEQIADGRITLWEAGGVPVSVAGVTLQVAGMIRVGPVYTPPDLRRRGYAAGVTAAVTQAAIDAGVAEVLLFTDLANQTSNGIYQRLGYHPVEDRVMLSFQPAEDPAPQDR